MKKLLLILPLVLLLCFTFGCQKAEEVAEEPVVDVEAAKEAIKYYFETYSSSIAEGNLDGWVDHCAEDMVAMPPNEAIIEGKESIRQWGKPFFDQYNQEELITIDEIEVAGNWAFVRYHYTLKLTPKAGGEQFQANGKGIWILRHQADGTWKASRAIWNGNDPLSASEENL